MVPAIWELDLRSACEALSAAGQGGVARAFAVLTSSGYRAARATLRAATAGGRKLADRELYSLAVLARDTVRRWADLGGGSPSAPRALADCQSSYQHLSACVAQLETWAGRTGFAGMGLEGFEQVLEQMHADRATLARLPELYRLRSSLQARGWASSSPTWRRARCRKSSPSRASGTPGIGRSSITCP
jgi:hypothetical protein